MLLATDARDIAERVDRSRVGAARRAHDGKRDEARAPILGNGPLERRGIHAPGAIAGDGVHMVARNPDDVQPLGDRAVRLLRHIGHAAAPLPICQHGVARGRERGEIGHRATRDEQAACGLGGKTRLAHEPGEQRVLGHASCRVVGKAARVAVVSCGDDVSKPRDGSGGAGDEAEEARMVGVVAVADDVVLHLAHHVVELASFVRDAAATDGVERVLRRFADHGSLR